jgi:hypothetical protein
VILASIFAAHDHGESIRKTKRIGNFEAEAPAVFLANALVDCNGIAMRAFAKYGSERRAGILDINIHIAAEHRFVYEKSAAKIGFSYYANSGALFDMLREQFRKDHLFGEEL